MANTLAYYDTATITAGKSFKVQAHGVNPTKSSHFLNFYEHFDKAAVQIKYSKGCLVACNCFTTGSAKANGREPKTGLGRVFNSKLGCIATPGSKCMVCMQPLLKL